MYTVTIINDGIETIINQPNTSNRITGTIKLGINTIDSFEFTIYQNNQGYNLISPYKTLVKVLNDKTFKYEFIGRVLIPSGSMEEDGVTSKSFVCESELGYLNDSMQSYGLYKNISVKDYLKIMIDKHNSIDSNKAFILGNVTVTDNNDSIYKYLDYASTMENIKSDLLETYGGEFQVRYEDDNRYLDYLTNIGGDTSTEIRLGKNIKSIAEEKDPTSYITRLYPLGNKLTVINEDGEEEEIEERLTISSVNNGKEYIENETAIEEFGVIEGYEFWDDVSDPNNLLTKGKNFLNSQTITISNNVTALDLSLIGIDIDSFKVGYYYTLIHELLDINYTVRIVEKNISIDNPQSTSITLGDKQKDIKQYQLDIKKQAEKTIVLEKEISSQNAKLNNINETLVETNESITAISESVETVGNEVIDLGTSTSKTINNMLESISLLSESISNINDTLESVNTSILNINNNISRINKNISTMQTDISNLDEKVNLIDTSVTDIDERVKVLEGGTL